MLSTKMINQNFDMRLTFYVFKTVFCIVILFYLSLLYVYMSILMNYWTLVVVIYCEEKGMVDK